jgi:hypothetical protein
VLEAGIGKSVLTVLDKRIRRKKAQNPEKYEPKDP